MNNPMYFIITQIQHVFLFRQLILGAYISYPLTVTLVFSANADESHLKLRYKA